MKIYQELVLQAVSEAMSDYLDVFDKKITSLDFGFEKDFDLKMRIRLRELQEYNMRESANIPIEDISRLLDKCNEIFSSCIQEIISIALDDAYSDFDNGIKKIFNTMHNEIRSEGA